MADPSPTSAVPSDPYPSGWEGHADSAGHERGKLPWRGSLTLAEVSKHCADEDMWIIIWDNVFEVTAYLDDHPGGPEVITDVEDFPDKTQQFEDTGHSEGGVEDLKFFHIGVLPGKKLWVPPSRQATEDAAAAAAAGGGAGGSVAVAGGGGGGAEAAGGGAQAGKTKLGVNREDNTGPNYAVVATAVVVVGALWMNRARIRRMLLG